MTHTSLEKFLEEQSLIPEESRLSNKKIEILKLAKKFADKIYRIDEGKNKKWRFCFDDGAFQGEYQTDINQKNLSPLSLLKAIDQINWPGLNSIVSDCNKKILEVLTNYKDNENL